MLLIPLKIESFNNDIILPDQSKHYNLLVLVCLSCRLTTESDGNQYHLSWWLKNFKVKYTECRKVLPLVGLFAMRKDRMRLGVFCEDLEQFNCKSGDFFLFPFCCFWQLQLTGFACNLSSSALVSVSLQRVKIL